MVKSIMVIQNHSGYKLADQFCDFRRLAVESATVEISVVSAAMVRNQLVIASVVRKHDCRIMMRNESYKTIGR